jgi:hypothetical protein
MARNAEAVLRATGATVVHVLREQLMTGTLQQRQLGQTQPQYADIAVGPAVVVAETTPPSAMKLNVILPAHEVNKHAQAEGVENGTAWLTGARGILYQGTLLRITEVKAEVMAGVEFLYYVRAEV